MSLRRIFVDTRAVFEVEPTVTQRWWPAAKHGEPVLVGDRPWERWGVSLYGSVLRDGSRLRMWYNAWPEIPAGDQAIYVAYAESADGIRWDKPNLGIHPFDNSPRTNLTGLFRSHPSVILDPDDPDPGLRYKAGGWVGPWSSIPKDRAGTYPDNGFYLARSADGLRWSDLRLDEQVGTKPDTGTFIRDEPRHRYVGAVKQGVRYGLLDRRSIAITESPDFVHWTRPRVVLVPDALDDRIARERGADHAQLYGMGMEAHDDFLLGFVWMFWPHLPLSRRTGFWGEMDVQLVYSYDGDYWHRTPDRQPFIALGPRGSFDGGQIVTATRPVVVDDEVRLYYSGSIGEHAFYLNYDRTPRTDVDWESRRPWNEDAISFAALKRDRYASLSTPGRGAFAVRHGPRDGDALFVNARCPRGHVKVQVLDARDAQNPTPVDGFGAADCRGFTGDDLRGEITWPGRSLADLPPDLPLAFRFLVEDADVFAYELTPG